MLPCGVVLVGMVRFIFYVTLAMGFVFKASAQQDVGPEIPIVLDHADSLLGSGSMESSLRTFIGNVRFRQGNVTGQCDKVVQDVVRNTVELRGSVVIRQADLTISAPEINYDGATSTAHAVRGIRLQQAKTVIVSQIGSYAMRSKRARFLREVHAIDDTIRLWCDSLDYDRRRDTMLARGNVHIHDTVQGSWFSGMQARRDASAGSMELVGEACAWSWSQDTSGVADTTFIRGDTLLSVSQGEADSPSMTALGNVLMVRGSTASRSGKLSYNDQSGRILLNESPVVWSDSSILQATSIEAETSGKRLQRVVGNGKAILLSRSDSLLPVRYDQIGGDQIIMSFEADSSRILRAIGKSVSITYRQESGQRKGLAKVAADTIDARIVREALTDVYWLGGVSGENHPERLVHGRESEFQIPGMVIPEGRPSYLPVPRRRSLLR
jgi:lipopolysaccharide export system protein LptA